MTPAPLRVLYVVHGHPAERPGGAEVYALELYRAAQASPDIEPYLLTRTARRGSPPVWVDPTDPRHFWLSTQDDDFDFLHQEYRPLGVVGLWLDRLLRDLAPDIVHFQHTLYVGLDLVRRVRDVVPGARVVYTLHEFFPICYHRGLMFRTQERVPCNGATPDRCHECFPDVSSASFAARAGHVRRRLAGVDLFVAPSRFLRDRYVEWGLPADRIVAEEYGRLPAHPTDNSRQQGYPLRTRFGYFGQLNAFKGVDVLLRAVLHLAASPGGLPAGFELHLHGANLELQPIAFQKLYRGLLDACRPLGVVTDHGPYSQNQSAGLVAAVDWVVVPSVWWENSPLVIQEAFAHGRPVLCSDIGGMREKVADGTDGLHFRAADPADLARVLTFAATTPGLWDRLRVNVSPPYPMSDHLRRLLELYRRPQRAVTPGPS